jgi:hypothetical protein
MARMPSVETIPRRAAKVHAQLFPVPRGRSRAGLSILRRLLSNIVSLALREIARMRTGKEARTLSSQAGRLGVV